MFMPRLARLDAPGVLHHVMGRGIERKEIFFNDTDRIDFIERLADIAEEGAMDVYAWVLMPNHFHLLCKTRNRPLSSSMRKILTGYVVNFNRRHRRYGHLFQNRYKSIVCQEDRYLKELLRYIHLNLLRAGLVKDIIELSRSPWSGHSALMGKIKREWQDTEYVLSFFGQNRYRRRNYQQYVKKGVALGRRPELVGGGLVRSLGGWSEVLALRGRSEKYRSDQRILGDSEFVQEVISGLDDLVKKNLRLSGRRMDISALAQQVCAKYDITLGELRSGSRRPDVVEARGSISWIAVRELGYSGADVARYLGVTNSCVTRRVASGPKPDVEEFIRNL
jgi:REP element-mobilizing transposase RayT